MFIDTVDIEHETIFCDKLRVSQILINIASNAVKYTNPGGQIRVKFTETAGAQEGYADFAFSVADTGIGMNNHLAKPIQIDRLYEMMREISENKQIVQ